MEQEVVVGVMDFLLKGGEGWIIRGDGGEERGISEPPIEIQKRGSRVRLTLESSGKPLGVLYGLISMKVVKFELL